MRIDALTTFPDMFTGPMSTSIMGRACKAGIIEFHAHDLRDWTHDRHKTTDDEIYGGGAGLLMKVEPIFEALDTLLENDDPEQPPLAPEGTEIIFFSPTGVPFDQRMAEELSTRERLIFVCGHYEGIDERAYTSATRVVSLGDYVLTGGELPAMVLADAVCRLIPGVLGCGDSALDESFSDGLLEYPQYTRPAAYRGMDVPDVLMSGNHGLIAKWRHEQALLRTFSLRPDLLSGDTLAEAERVARALDPDSTE